MHSNLYLSWISGLLLSLSCGFLGAFVVWRKMSSFGNTLSHASLLGLSISLLLNIDAFYVVLFIVIILTIIIVYLEYSSDLSLDAILGVITYSSLSLGMIIINIIPKDKKTDLSAYLFGDLLLLKKHDFIIILLMSAIILITLIYFWKNMISVIISSELSYINGINVFKMRLILMIMTALLIGISTKLIGALLITSLLIIPPITVQKFISSPEQMVIYSIIINMISITFGVIFSIFYNLPISPIIILFESMIFFISIML
ncbi:High-affinity zinc uptake system membrane protein ZnuB [Buchnera aphidicola (Symydobius americanus)]